jgi:Peptidase family S41
MFEHFCVLLLRLYPAEFRRVYGGDAVQLMRDRARHERGAFRRVRLLMDLAIDLGALSLHGWRQEQRSLAATDGRPRFDIIQVEAPRPAALAVGMMTSILMFAAFPLLFQPRALAKASAYFEKLSQAEKPASPAQPAQPAAVTLDPEARRKLVAAIAANIEERYVDRAIGKRLADLLRAHDKNGEYNRLDTATLAAFINADIKSASRTLGIPRGLFVADVMYSARPLPEVWPPPMTEEARQRQRAVMRDLNCLFEKVEKLPRNVGYIKLNGMADAAICSETTARVMASLNDSAALIVDVRDNPGGFGDTALQIAGYLFDRPAFMYSPRPGSDIPTRTASPVSANKLTDKPVYLLTSPRTQSAAEYFVYNLKMLKRVTVVGETTGGRQHSGTFRRIDEHVGVGVQEVAPDNPYPVKGWELIGIEPDVRVTSAEALETAKKFIEETASSPASAQPPHMK